VLLLFDLLALCALLYLLLMAAVPDCGPVNRSECDASRAFMAQLLMVTFWATVAVNAGYLVLSRRKG